MKDAQLFEANMKKIRKLSCLFMIKDAALGTFPGYILFHKLAGAQRTPG